MTYSSWLLVARVCVTLALLAIVAVLLMTSPFDGDHPLASLIVGSVLGYWLGHAEVATVKANTE